MLPYPSSFTGLVGKVKIKGQILNERDKAFRLYPVGNVESAKFLRSQVTWLGFILGGCLQQGMSQDIFHSLVHGNIVSTSTY